MINQLKCQSLFTFDNFYLKECFLSFKYPWEIIAQLKDILLSIISDGIDGYQRQGNGVLVGKDVRIAHTARIDGPTVIGDGCEIGCNCVLNPGTVIGKNTNIYPLSSVRGTVDANCIYKALDNIVPKHTK